MSVYDAYQAKEEAQQKKKFWQLFDEVTEQLDFFYVSERVTYKGEDGEADVTLDLVKMEKALADGTISVDDEDIIKDLRKTVRARKANAIKRQQRIAEQYVANIERGIFPLYTKR